LERSSKLEPLLLVRSDGFLGRSRT